MSDWLDVCIREELPPGSRQVVAGPDEDILVINADGVIYAVADECSHQALSLSEGGLDGDILTCPWHSADFCLKTGEALSPPAYEPIACYEVRIVHDLIQVAATPKD